MHQPPYIKPETNILTPDTTPRLMAGSEESTAGVDNKNNINIGGSIGEGGASGAHSKSFDFDTEEVWGDGWE